MEIRVDLGDKVLRLVTRRSIAYEANAHIFVLWMLGAMLVLLAVAIIFLRNQIRPILRLAQAAEDFGKGRDLDFRPHGAREVRQAGYAFVEMKRRVERATEQRTAMLNGVSHDLRTMLTRFKFSLALIDEFSRHSKCCRATSTRCSDARGLPRLRRAATPARRPHPIDLGAARRNGLGGRKHGAPVAVEASGELGVKVRPLPSSAASATLSPTPSATPIAFQLAATREQRFISIHVDDDGPGIAAEYREDVFRPFYRLDDARNQDEGAPAWPGDRPRHRAFPRRRHRSLDKSPGRARASVGCRL